MSFFTRILCSFILLFSSITMAQEAKRDRLDMPGGKVYLHATIKKINECEVLITHDSGIKRIAIESLPDELKKEIGYDPEKAIILRDKIKNQIKDENKLNKEIAYIQKNKKVYYIKLGVLRSEGMIAYLAVPEIEYTTGGIYNGKYRKITQLTYKLNTYVKYILKGIADPSKLEMGETYKVTALKTGEYNGEKGKYDILEVIKIETPEYQIIKTKE